MADYRLSGHTLHGNYYNDPSGCMPISRNLSVSGPDSMVATGPFSSGIYRTVLECRWIYCHCVSVTIRIDLDVMGILWIVGFSPQAPPCRTDIPLHSAPRNEPLSTSDSQWSPAFLRSPVGSVQDTCTARPQTV